MADQVLHPNEILLNGVYYPISGQVRPVLASVFPGKVVIGDYSKENEQIRSSLAISEYGGGIGVEEMDEKIHADRNWWSTCHQETKGHLLLPPLATSITMPAYPGEIVDAGFEIWTDASTLTNWTFTALGGSNATLTRNTAQKRSGTYCAQITTSTLGDPGARLSQSLTWDNNYRGKTVTFYFYGYLATAASSQSFTVNIYDGIGTSSTSSSATTYTKVSVTRTIDTAATELTLRIEANRGTGTVNLYIDDANCDAPYTGTVAAWEEFNGLLYMASGRNLCKLNATGDGFTFVKNFAARITDIKRSIGNNLYIALGDSIFYQYMSTAEAFTETNVADAQFLAHWDGKLFKINTTGQLSYATVPNSATPTWTNNGTLADLGIIAGDIQHLLVYRDAAAIPVIYAATKRGLYAHDFSGAQWLETELTLPSHATSGKGFIKWRDAAYLSAGLNVLKYIAAGTATIATVGLDRDDGVPAEHRGEIMDMFAGHQRFYAQVDASQIAGTQYSFLASSNGQAWYPIYIGGADQVVAPGCASSIYAYRCWFVIGDNPRWIALQRDIQNPLKISGYEYAASGIHITPWFDADWSSSDKLALSIKLYCDGMSATETVVVKYRINHSNTDRDTGWTTMGTIIADGATEYTFGSGAGITFSAIQFRFDLARGATTTLTPDLQWWTFFYLKKPEIAWGWWVDVDCTKEWKGRSPEQLYDTLVTAVSSGTLVNFLFTDDPTAETHKVEIRSMAGQNATGEDKRGRYSLFMVEP